MRPKLLVVALLSAVGWAQGLVEDLYRDATAAMNQGDWAKAEFLFRDMRLEAPKDERWGPGLMTALEMQNKLQDALKAGRELVGQNSRSMTGHFRVGRVLMALNRPPEAMTEFEAALRYSTTPSEQAISYNMIGDAHRYMGELDEAIAAFLKARDLGSGPNPVLAMVLGERGRHEEEVAEYRAVLRVAPDLPVALNNLAYGFAERGENLDESLAMAMRAVSVEPGNSSYVDTLAWIYFKKGMLAEAETTMVDALQREGGVHPTLREHLGEVMDARGDWSGERRELRRLMNGELTPNQLVRMKELLRKTQGQP